MMKATGSEFNGAPDQPPHVVYPPMSFWSPLQWFLFSDTVRITSSWPHSFHSKPEGTDSPELPCVYVCVCVYVYGINRPPNNSIFFGPQLRPSSRGPLFDPCSFVETRKGGKRPYHLDGRFGPARGGGPPFGPWRAQDHACPLLGKGGDGCSGRAFQHCSLTEGTDRFHKMVHFATFCI